MNLYQAALMGTLLATVYAAVPTEWKFELETDAPWPNGETNVKLGEAIQLKATLDIPAGTSNDVMVELLSSVLPTVFAIVAESINVTVGSNINNGDGSFAASRTDHDGNDYDSGGPIVYKTRSVFNIGSLTNSGSSTNVTESQIVFRYEVVFVTESTVGYGSIANTSVGVEYEHGGHIILSHQGFTLKIEEIKPGTNSFVINCPTEIEVLTVTTCQLTMNVPTVSISAEVIVGSANEKLYVADIIGNSVGTSFGGFVFPSRFQARSTNVCRPDGASLTMKKLININAMRQVQDATFIIVVDIKVRVLNPELVGETLSPSITVKLNDVEAHVETPNLKVKEQPNPPSMPPFTFGSSPTSILQGHPDKFEILIPTPKNSGLVYELKISIAVKTGSSKLSILAVNPSSYGDNLCPIDPLKLNVTTTSSSNDDVKDGAIVTFLLTNHGMQASTAEDDLKLNVVVMVMPGSNENDEFNVTFELVASGTSKTTPTRVGPAQPYPDNVDFMLNIERNCVDDDHVYQPGTTALFVLYVQTKRNVVSGEFEMELPIPLDVDNYFVIRSAIVTEVGKNVMCVQLGSLLQFTENSKWVPESDVLDRVVIKLPLVCNFEVLDDTNEDEFAIVFNFLIKEYPGQTEQRNLTLGGGVKYSTTQVWVFALPILVDPPAGNDATDNFTQTYSAISVYINVSTFNPATGWPGYMKLQWSPDNSNFIDYKHGYESPISLSEDDVEIRLKRPLTARYVRIINMEGQCLGHTYKTEPAFPMYGSRNKKDEFMQQSEFLKDGDDSTCVDLPFTTETSMTPFMWVELPKSVFGINDNATKFKVNITGEGLQCQSRSGPQITYIMYPKETPTANFQGKMMLCIHTGNNTVYVDKILCEYVCRCQGEEQCSHVSIFMMHKENATDYKLCEVKMALYN